MSILKIECLVCVIIGYHITIMDLCNMIITLSALLHITNGDYTFCRVVGPYLRASKVTVTLQLTLAPAINME